MPPSLTETEVGSMIDTAIAKHTTDTFHHPPCETMKEFRQSFYWVMGVAGAIVVFGTAWLVGRQESNSADAKVLQVDAAQARATVQYLQTDIAEIKADIKTLLRKEKQ